jgi:KRAB domain-containing zinc finger protein
MTVMKTELDASSVVTFAEELAYDNYHSENDDDDDNRDDDSDSNDDHPHLEEINMPESEDEDTKANLSDPNDPDYGAKFEKFRCEQCPKTFTRRPQLVAHQSTHRQHTIHACPRHGCNSSFAVSHRLIRHLRNVHDADEDEVDEMRDSIKALRPIKQGAAVKEPVPAGKVQCEVCHKVLANKRYLKEHLELQHLKTAKYACTHDGCKKRFKIWSLYEMHMKKHSGQHDFVCRFCGKGYVQRKIFNSHLRNSHQVSQDEIDRLRWSVNGAEMRDNKCQECRIEFKTPHKLFEHKALVHGEGKRYICDICGKAFFSKAFLASHQKYHKGVKNRKCTKCPSAFTEDKGLRTHLRRVHHMTDEEVYALGIMKN